MDFDELKELYERDPTAFDAKRAEMIEAAINKWPAESQERMRRFQFRIDRELRDIKDPFVRANRVYYMMLDQLDELNDAWKGLFPEKIREKAPVVHLFEA